MAKQFKTAQEINALIKEQAKNTIKWSQKELKDIYRDNWDYIIEQELSNQFTIDTWKDLHTIISGEFNILKRIINEIAIIYKEVPERTAVLSEGENPKIDERYEEILKESDINIIMPIVNKMTELLNQCLVRPVWRNGKIEYDLHLFDNTEILTDDKDWKKIKAVKFYIGQRLPFYSGRFSEDTDGNTSQFFDITRPQETTEDINTHWEKAYLWTLEDYNEEAKRYTNSYIYTIKPLGKGKEEVVKKENNDYRGKDGYPILPFVLFQKNYPVYVF